MPLFQIKMHRLDCQCIINWWRRRASNPQPPECKSGARPLVLHPHVVLIAGLEPTTPNVSDWYSTIELYEHIFSVPSTGLEPVHLQGISLVPSPFG